MKLFFTITVLQSFFTASVFGTDEQPQGHFRAGTNLRRKTSETGPMPQNQTSETGPMPQNQNLVVDGEARHTKLIAEAMGVDVPTAEKHLSVMLSFKALVGKMEKHEAFAASVMAKMPGDPVQVFFKGTVPEEFLKDFEVFESENKAKIEKIIAKRSRIENELLTEKVMTLLGKKGFSGVGYAIHVDRLQFSAVVPNGNAEDDMSQDKEITYEKLTAKAKQVLGEDLDADELDGVLLYLSSQRLYEDHHTRGGRRVYSSGRGGSCTSGFSVEQVETGITGIATAGHCRSVDMYDTEQAGESDYGMSFQGRSIGHFGDLEWFTTRHFHLPEFFASASPTDIWRVNAYDWVFSENDWVCGYSRMTGRNWCDRIFAVNVGASEGARNLIAMTHNNMEPGDSGGPWSYGHTASGIHKGEQWVRTGRVLQTCEALSQYASDHRSIFLSALGMGVQFAVGGLEVSYQPRRFF
jgi:hypothetical protein